MKKLMNRMNNKKGFTLAELLIVVAIIGVLAAISIPVITTQLERSRQATNTANIRSAYAQAQACVILGSDVGDDKVSFAYAYGGFDAFNANNMTGTVIVSGVTTLPTTKTLANYTDATWPEGASGGNSSPQKSSNAKVLFTYNAGKLTTINLRY